MAQVVLIYTETDLPSGFGPFHQLIDALRAIGVPTEGSVVQVHDRKIETGILNEAAATTLSNKPAAPRGRPRKTDNGAQAAQAKAQTPQPEDVATADPDDDVDPDQDPDLAEGALSDAEAKEQGMLIVRQLPKTIWQEIRQKMNISLFSSLPEERGHELYKLAVAAAEKAGLRP